MFQSFKSLFYNNPTQKLFERAGVDATYSSLNLCFVSDLQRHLKTPAVKQAFLEQLFKGIQSSKWAKRLKYLITVHYLVVHTEDAELIEGFMHACERRRSE